MLIYYRISDNGYRKEKPSYVNKISCLRNALNVFRNRVDTFHIVADNCNSTTMNYVENLAEGIDCVTLEKINIGNGAGTFRHVLKRALEESSDDSEIVYFLEDDYLHTIDADKAIEACFKNLNPDFLTLYDHPDKYLEPSRGGNRYCTGGSEVTRVFIDNEVCHWKLTNSTTMTFASRISTLKKVREIIEKYTATTHPRDFDMFLDFRNRGYTLLSPIPSKATHGESNWLAPFVKWNKFCNI